MAAIVPSEELRALVLQWYRLWEAHDIDAFEKYWTVSPLLLTVGSDEAEWHSGSAAVNIFLAQLEELPDFTVTSPGQAAYRLGDVGWIADQPLFCFAGAELLDPHRLL